MFKLCLLFAPETKRILPSSPVAKNSGAACGRPSAVVVANVRVECLARNSSTDETDGTDNWDLGFGIWDLLIFTHPLPFRVSLVFDSQPCQCAANGGIDQFVN